MKTLPQIALLIAALAIGSAGIATDALVRGGATGAVAILTAALLAMAIPVQAKRQRHKSGSPQFRRE